MRYFDVPLAEHTRPLIDWTLNNFGPLFDLVSSALRGVMEALESMLLSLPAELIALVIIVVAWQIAGRGVALFALLGLLLIGGFDAWEEAIRTLVIVLTSTLLSMMIGIPLGILTSQNELVHTLMRPVLDFMQTMPSFVYLIPALMLFGIGSVPAVFATIVFATPPAVRLTALGIRQVPKETTEAAIAFGSTRMQMLTKVQLPIALPTIMAGVNQTIMLALSMAVISAMIGAGGLGGIVLAAISRVEPGIGLEGGLGIVVLAIILDRITQALGRRDESFGNRV